MNENFEVVLRLCSFYNHYRQEASNMRARTKELWRPLNEITFYTKSALDTENHLKSLRTRIEAYLKDEVA